VPSKPPDRDAINHTILTVNDLKQGRLRTSATASPAPSAPLRTVGNSLTDSRGANTGENPQSAPVKNTDVSTDGSHAEPPPASLRIRETSRETPPGGSTGRSPETDHVAVKPPAPAPAPAPTPTPSPAPAPEQSEWLKRALSPEAQAKAAELAKRPAPPAELARAMDPEVIAAIRQLAGLDKPGVWQRFATKWG
jgi:hypothetical protein